MPNYTYTDNDGHQFDIVLPYDWDDEIICAACGVEMWRKPPDGVAVNWGGLAPSAAVARSPEMNAHLDPNTLDERRAEFERTK